MNKADLSMDQKNDASDIRFDDLFSLENVQRLQDAFAAALGVAMAIVDPQGRNLTQPSNCCRWCREDITGTPEGRANCRRVILELIDKTRNGASFQYCEATGLLDGGAGIFVGDQQIAVVLVGQVNDGSRAGRESGAGAAGDAGIVMSHERFQNILTALYLFASQISTLGLRNLQQEREIVERRRKDEALREINGRLTTLIEAIPDVIFFKDAAGRNQVVNRAYEKLLRLPREAIIGRFDEDIMPPTLVEQCRVSDVETIAARQPRRYEELIAGENGETSFMETIKAPILAEAGEVVGLVGVSRDVTDRRRAEQAREKLETQLRQAQRMEAVGRLAGGVAHDFNNIMTGINGYAEMILATLSPDSELYRDVEEIRKAGERASRLTNQLLAFSRKQIYAPRPIRLDEIVSQSTVGLMQLLGSNVELELATEPNLWNVKADPNQIHEILLNLTANARDAMPEGGRVLIYTGNVELRGEKTIADDEPISGKFVQLSVSDNGRGIAPDIKDFIFEPFFTTKGKEKGGGLGLATVYGIVKQNHGHLKFFSEIGMGATFIVYLPALEQTAAAEEPAPAAHLPTGSETVLLAVEEPIIRQLSKRILEGHGYRVLEAADGQEALAIAETLREDIALLLVDEVTLIISGGRLPERLRGIYPQLRTLIMEGGPSETTGRGEGRVNTTTMQKPFTVEAMLTKVRKAIDGAR